MSALPVPDLVAEDRQHLIVRVLALARLADPVRRSPVDQLVVEHDVRADVETV